METENQGALAFLKLFDPSRIKFCSVHSVNLGYAFWLGGSVIHVLVNELTIFDEFDVPENRAILDFSRWCANRKILYLCLNIFCNTSNLIWLVLASCELRCSQPKLTSASSVEQREYPESAKACNVPEQHLSKTRVGYTVLLPCSNRPHHQAA